jgi:hypothetical protein
LGLTAMPRPNKNAAASDATLCRRHWNDAGLELTAA